MKCNPITGFFGAEVTGLDLRKKIDTSVKKQLQNALSEHLVIVIREQWLDADQQRALAKVFGEPAVNPYAPGLPAFPEMTHIIKEAKERTGVFGGGWHTDLSFLDHPPRGSVLCAIEVPPFGGDTMFSSQHVAWDTLPEPFKIMLDGRKIAHVGKPYGVKWAPPIEEQSMKGSTKRETQKQIVSVGILLF